MTVTLSFSFLVYDKDANICGAIRNISGDEQGEKRFSLSPPPALPTYGK